MSANTKTPADRLAEAVRPIIGFDEYDDRWCGWMDELRAALAAYDARKRVSESDLARATYSAWLPHLRVGMAESDAAWLDVSRAAMRVMGYSAQSES